jgi:DNA-binding GntR family transcriptional regulator
MKMQVPARPPGAPAGAVDGCDLRRQALQSLPEQIAERIYAAIVGGDYLPGERIREEELARAFGVSRGPVREALRILERDSVVRVIANRGAHVTPLSARELNDIFEIRRVLAGAMVRRLGNADPALLARFGEKVRQLERVAGAADQAGYVAGSVEVSLMLAQVSGNERLAEIMRSLARQSWRYTQLALKDPQRRRESARNWRALFDALSRGQGEVAGQAMEKLVEDARVGAVRLLAAEGGAEPAPTPELAAAPAQSARSAGLGRSRPLRGAVSTHAGAGRPTSSAFNETT